MSPKTEAKLKSAPVALKGSNHAGKFIIEDGKINGYPYLVSQVCVDASANDYIGLDTINAVCQEAGFTSVNMERGLVALDPGGLDNYVSAKDMTMMVKELYTGSFDSIGTDFMKEYFHISEGDSLPTLAGLAPSLSDASVLNQNGHGMTRYNETAVIEDGGALYILTIMLHGDSGMVYSPAVTDVAEYVGTAMAG